MKKAIYELTANITPSGVKLRALSLRQGFPLSPFHSKFYWKS